MADILIKGMEMPKTCDECLLCEELATESFDYCRLLKADTDRGVRRSDCPLVELPTPHGRLGDLDRIEKKIQGKIDDVPIAKDGTRTTTHAFYVNGLLRAKELVGNEWTVVPASEETD